MAHKVSRVAKLDSREEDVVALIADGLSNQEVGARLCVLAETWELSEACRR